MSPLLVKKFKIFSSIELNALLQADYKFKSAEFY